MSKNSFMATVLTVYFLLHSTATCVLAIDGWVNINGNVNYKGQPVCAMVLANGQYAFSCSGDGSFNYNVPLDANGNITVQVFCSGRAPYRQTIGASEAEGLVIVMEDTDSNAGLNVSTTFQVTSSTRCNLSGSIASNGQPVCAMALANGQYMFTCSGDGSFYLDVPLNSNGQVTFYAFGSGKQPYKYIHTPDQIDFSVDNDEDGFSITAGDCNDLDADINPAATEICGDGIDQNCDGMDTPCSSPNCQNIAGRWSENVQGSMVVSAEGTNVSETINDVRTIDVTQNGCQVNLAYQDSGYYYSRTGEVDGSSLQVSGKCYGDNFDDLIKRQLAMEGIIGADVSVLQDAFTGSGSIANSTIKINGTADIYLMVVYRGQTINVDVRVTESSSMTKSTYGLGDGSKRFLFYDHASVAASVAGFIKQQLTP